MVFVAFGDSVLAEIRRRMAAKSVPTWLKNFKSGQGSKHISNLSYLNLSKIKSKLTRFTGSQGAATIAAMGLDNAETLESCTGLTDKSSFSRIFLKLDGRPEGMLDLSGPKGLTDADLNQFPADSLFAAGISLDLRRSFGLFNTAIMLMSNGRENLFEILDDMQRETGIEFQQDIIANLGKSWTLYNGAGDGWLTGMTMTTTVKDAGALAAATDKVIKTILKESRRSRYGPAFSRRQVGDNTITSFSVQNTPIFVEPSWCIAEDRLIVGLYPQAVESALKFASDQNKGDGPLLSEEDFQFLRSSFSSRDPGTKLLAMTHVDAASNFEISYPYMQVVISLIKSSTSEFTRGMPEKVAAQISELLDGLQLPRARVIHRHLEPSLLAVRQTDDGIEFETRQTIPSLDIGYTIPVAAAALLPAIKSSRAAAKRIASQNNMRMLMLASLNYESAHMQFPPAYRVNKEGKSLLSWRVQILPFIEQNNLYEQFRHDEPWDSPNNIALLEKMPEVFRSPSSKAAPGKTVYRGIGGKSGVLQPFGDGKLGAIGFGQITDGSSNTIYAIETSDELAIEWTKPSSGIDPDSFDAKQLFGNQIGGTNVVMCDGSVQFVSELVDPEALKKLMTRNGGEIANLPRPNRSRRSRRARVENVDVDPRFKIRSGKPLRLEDMMTEADRKDLAIDESKEKMKKIALSMLNFQSAYRRYPAAYSTDRAGKPLLSWRVHVLPFVGETQLYNQFRLNEPWDSDHNRELIKKIPAIFKTSKELPIGKTCVLANGSEGGLIGKPDNGRNVGSRLMDIRDGTSNTIMFINADAESAVEWTKPEVFYVDDDVIPRILATEPIIALGDGSVHIFKSDFPLEKFKAMLTIAGGEVVQNMTSHTKD
jgi:prepilin-type processing-associated H-X9-DG protein